MLLEVARKERLLERLVGLDGAAGARPRRDARERAVLRVAVVGRAPRAVRRAVAVARAQPRRPRHKVLARARHIDGAVGPREAQVLHGRRCRRARVRARCRAPARAHVREAVRAHVARARAPLPLPLLLLLLPLSLPLSLSLVKSPVLVLHESKQLSLSLASLPLPLRLSLVTLPVGVMLDSAECARAADWCGGITVSPNDGSRGSLFLLVWLCIPNSLLCCSVTDEKKVAKKKKMATISFRRKKCVCLQSSLHWTKKNSVAKEEF